MLNVVAEIMFQLSNDITRRKIFILPSVIVDSSIHIILEFEKGLKKRFKGPHDRSINSTKQ